MASTGIAGAPSPAAAHARRYGRRSIFLAGVGLFLLCALAILTAAMPGVISDHSALAGARMLAPMINLAGAIFAIAGLVQSPAKVAPGLGLLLNLIVLAGQQQIAATIAGSF